MVQQNKTQRKTTDLPSLGDLRNCYLLRWDFFRSAIGDSWRELLRKNAIRLILTVVFVGAIVAGAVTADWKAVAWPAVILLTSFVLTAGWIWFASACAVVRDARGESDILKKHVARQRINTSVADKLQALFDDGLALLKSENAEGWDAFEWAEKYELWREVVCTRLEGLSKEEKFMFRSIGFEHEIVIYREPRLREETAKAVRRALNAKLDKLRLVIGRTYKAAEGGIYGL